MNKTMKELVREQLSQFSCEELIGELVTRGDDDNYDEQFLDNGVVWYDVRISTGYHPKWNTIRGGLAVDQDYIESLTEDDGKAIHDFHGGDPYLHPKYARYCEEFGPYEQRDNSKRHWLDRKYFTHDDECEWRKDALVWEKGASA